MMHVQRDEIKEKKKDWFTQKNELVKKKDDTMKDKDKKKEYEWRLKGSLQTLRDDPDMDITGTKVWFMIDPDSVKGILNTLIDDDWEPVSWDFTVKDMKGRSFLGTFEITKEKKIQWGAFFSMM